MEPAVVVQDLAGAGGILVVAQHDVVAPAYDLAFAGLGIDIVQPDFHSVGGDADGADALGLVHHHVAHERGGFGQTVAHGIRETAVLEELFHGRVHLGAAHAEEAEFPAEGLHQTRADEHVQDLGHVLLQPGEDAALLDRRDDTVPVDLLHDERHREHDGRSHLLHGRNQDARSRGFLQVVAAGTHVEGVDGRNAHLIGVCDGKDRQEPVLLEARLRLEGGRQIVGDVPVRKHHALGVAGGSGGVDDRGQVVRLGHGGPSVALEIFVVLLDELEGLDVDDKGHPLVAGRRNLAGEALGNEDDLGLGVGEDVRDLVLGAVRKDGNGDAPERGRGEKSDDPVGHALREDRHLVAGADPVAGHPLGELVALGAERFVGIALAAVHELVGGPFGIGGSGVLIDLPQGRAVILAISVFPPGLVVVLCFLGHRGVGQYG